MKIKLVFLLLICVTICSCSTDENEHISSLYDKNNDGIQDIFYEDDKDGGYYELSDSNYDGKVDQSCKYNSNDVIESCRFDQDFNNYLETFVKYRLGMPVKEGVDKNNDELYEVVFHYRDGILYQGFKYVEAEKEALIKHTLFKYGFPSDGQENVTDLSIEEFSDLYWTKFTFDSQG